MVRRVQLFKCDICGTDYRSVPEATTCENRCEAAKKACKHPFTKTALVQDDFDTIFLVRYCTTCDINIESYDLTEAMDDADFYMPLMELARTHCINKESS